MAPQRKFWACHGKDCKGLACGYQVPVGKIACDACGHQPPLHISCPGKAEGGKAAGRKGGKPESAPTDAKAKGKGVGRTTEQQLKAALEAKNAAESTNKANAKALTALQAEFKKFKAGQAKPEKDADPMAVDVASQFEHDDKEAKAALNKKRAMLKKLRNLEAELLEDPSIQARIATLDMEIEQAAATLREKRPLDTRMASQTAHLARMEAAEAQATDAVADITAQQEELAKQAATLLAAQAAAATKVLAAKEDLAVLKAQKARNLAAELGDSGTPVAAAAAPPPTGYVEIAFAEAKWNEREVHLQEQMAQLQALVATQREGSGQADQSPSEAGDIQSIDQLVDDEAWGKVSSGKRKAVLQRERDLLAGKVRNLSKVSTAASPFKK